jgi:hypothetical protein
VRGTFIRVVKSVLSFARARGLSILSGGLKRISIAVEQREITREV